MAPSFMPSTPRIPIPISIKVFPNIYTSVFIVEVIRFCIYFIQCIWAIIIRRCARFAADIISFLVIHVGISFSVSEFDFGAAEGIRTPTRFPAQPDFKTGSLPFGHRRIKKGRPFGRPFLHVVRDCVDALSIQKKGRCPSELDGGWDGWIRTSE